MVYLPNRFIIYIAISVLTGPFPLRAITVGFVVVDYPGVITYGYYCS
jgi:hypothetical protein